MDKIKKFVTEHPQWTSWIVLAIGMVAILVWSARDVGLLPGQWAALIIATILVAGLAVWIIGWEDEEEEADETDTPEATPATAAVGEEPAEPVVVSDEPVSEAEDPIDGPASAGKAPAETADDAEASQEEAETPDEGS